MSCILCHRGVKLILADSWARPTILVAGKGRGGKVFISVSSLSFLFLSSLYLSFISSTIASIFFLTFSGRRHKMTNKGWRVVKPQHNQLINNPWITCRLVPTRFKCILVDSTPPLNFLTRLQTVEKIYFIIGIKHVFSCINIRQVPREVLKTEAGCRGFQHLPRDLANVNALKSHVRSLLLHKKCYISRYFLHYFVSPFHRCLVNVHVISTDYACSTAGQYTSRDGNNSVAPVRAY